MIAYKLRNTLSLLILALLIFGSCKKDEQVQPALQSFGPTTVKHGETIKFIGVGLDQVTNIIMPVDIDVPASAFITHTSSLIEIKVPDESVAGYVTLKTSKGDITTKTIFGAAYEIAVTSFTPTSAKPGTNITINGDFLNYVKQVTFAQNQVVTEFVSQSLHQLVVQVPMAAQTGPIVLSDLAKTPQVVDQDVNKSSLILNVSLPAVSELSPSSVRQTQNLTVTGTDLDLVTKIDFPVLGGNGTVLASGFVSQSETQIVLTVPASAINGKLTLTSISEVQVVTAQSISIIQPNVSALSPSDPSSQVAGATLSLTGTDLDLVAKIKFPGVTDAVTSFILTGTTKIDVVIPQGVQGGTVILITQTQFSVPVSVPFGNQLTLLQVIYDDAIHSPFGQGGGWGTGGSTTDVTSTENPRVGTKSVKVTYGGDWGGGCQFGTWSSSPLSTNGTSYFAFSIYGGAGTGGKTINVNVSGVQKAIPIVEGAWSDVKIALSDVNNPASISEVWFQDMGWSGTVYIDQIGLK
jgi:hypothetical protein